MTTCSAGSYLSDTTPVLAARFEDPDGQDVSAKFEILSGETAIWSTGYGSPAPSGDHQAATVSSGTLVHGTTYVWRARGRDTSNRQGPWSPLCEFTVDTVRPDAPTVVSETYPEDQVSGGVGTAGAFSFTSSSDTASFRYSLNGMTPTTVDAPALGMTTTVNLAPTSAGAQRLSVEAIDRAGNVSDTSTYQFAVPFAASFGAHWTMNAGTSPEPDGAPGGAHPLTVPADVDRVDGAFKSFVPDAFPDDLALRFDGADGGATTEGRAVNTAESFTMSALVRADDVSATERVAVSQDGRLYGGAQLGQLASGDCPEGLTTCFGFTMRTADSSDRSLVASDRPIAPGEWVHLAGVWDASAQQMTLYTCAIGTPPSDFPADSGVPIATSAAFESTGWPAEGPVRIGSALVDGRESHRWNGAIDEVRLYASAKTESDVRRICGGDSTY
ncbi:LamG domain-containing protein [Nocardioides sp. CCNWLW239]|uniref:LamG domain-containing protein n=1 Tax=Nocardioides sp. CCNWLW239 TaxID=3128902 RepID=UPI0030183EF9